MSFLTTLFIGSNAAGVSNGTQLNLLQLNPRTEFDGRTRSSKVRLEALNNLPELFPPICCLFRALLKAFSPLGPADPAMESATVLDSKTLTWSRRQEEGCMI